jgi:3-phenylpropionate/trans-cinnamate dioxygenase ferredoxin component
MAVSDLEMSALSLDSRQVVKHEGLCILVCNAGGTHYAIENRCTHQDTPLHEGRIRNGLISCPLHGVRFDLKTGEPRGDLTRIAVRTFAVEQTGDQLRVQIDEMRANE